LLSIAKEKAKTPQQVLIMWGLQQGLSQIPKSVTKERIEANFELDGWELTEDERTKISSIRDRFKVCGDDWLPVQVFFGDDE
jgi:glycerol 2-dehydrogenase (NADP+)